VRKENTGQTNIPNKNIIIGVTASHDHFDVFKYIVQLN
tara:strand:- start:249 stop:362 length:114 start_codon:yes stop_codon:yes gene_type:complete